jgi:hypothetical protein
MEPTRIGSRLFVGEDGRQFVLDNDGNPIHGVWIYIPELDPDPVIVPNNAANELSARRAV